MRVVALADTHAPRRWKSCPPPVARQLRRADVVLHAGDVCTAAVLDELSGYAPVLAVLGNNDGPDVAEWGARETLQTDLDGLPAGGRWREVINTDAAEYGGSGVGNLGAVEAVAEPWHGRPFSAAVTLPPLGVLWLAPEA